MDGGSLVKVSHRLQSQKMLVGKTKYEGVFVKLVFTQHSCARPPVGGEARQVWVVLKVR